MADPGNGAIADQLVGLAGLLELDGASPYAARAYRRAAELVRALPVPVAGLVREGRVRELRGIGPGIEARLRELVETGELAELRRLADELDPELVALGRLLGLGAARSVAIGRALGLRSAAGLREAIERGEVERAPGVGPVTAARLREALTRPPRPPRGLLLPAARALVGGIAAALGGAPAGDPRRACDLSYALAVVCAAEEPGPLLDQFAALPQVVAIVERSDGRALGLTVEGAPVEVVVAPPAAAGTALVRATGSAAYVDSLGPLPAVPTEEAVFAALGLGWRVPELRELPLLEPPGPLVELAQIRGDLHCHTTASDGRASVLEMGRAARERGLEYLAICDHTPAVRVVAGLDADALRRQREEIAAANERLAPFRLLCGVECDVLPDGSLDLPDDVLAGLDWVQASVHAGQRAPARELTDRVLAALRHPAVRALSHPRGRILNHRPANALDLDAVLEVARETGVALEVNGLADRLDLSAEDVRRTLAAGVTLVVCSDAHSTRGLASIELAVATARRGGATAADVLNARPLHELLAAARTG